MNKLMIVAAMVWGMSAWAQGTMPATASAPASQATTQPTTTSQRADEEPQEPPLPAGYEFLVKELELSPRQVSELKVSVQKVRDTLVKWDKENNPKIKALQQELVDSYRAGDRDAIKPLQDQLAKLQKERRTIVQQHEKEFQDILSPAQKQRYDVLRVTSDALQPYAKLELNDRQVDVIKTLSAKAHEEMLKAGNDKAKVDAIYDQLYKDIEAKVLTAEQRAALKAKPATQPATTPAAPKGPEPDIKIEKR